MTRSKRQRKCKQIKNENKNGTTISKSSVTKTAQKKSNIHDTCQSDIKCNTVEENAESVSNSVLIRELQNDSKQDVRNTRQSKRKRNSVGESKAIEQKQRDSTLFSACQKKRNERHDTFSNSVLSHEFKNDSKLSERSKCRSKINWNSVSESRARGQNQNDSTAFLICQTIKKVGHDPVSDSILSDKLKNDSEQSAQTIYQSKRKANSISESRAIEQNQKNSTLFSICQTDGKESHDIVSESSLSNKLHSDSKAYYTNLPKEESPICEFLVKIEKNYVSLKQHHAKYCSFCCNISLQTERTEENPLNITKPRDLEINLQSPKSNGDVLNNAILANPYVPSQELISGTSLKAHANYVPLRKKDELNPLDPTNEPALPHSKHEPTLAHSKYEPKPLDATNEPAVPHSKHEPTLAHSKCEPTRAHSKCEPTPAHSKCEPNLLDATNGPALPHSKHKPTLVRSKHESIPMQAKYEVIPVCAKYQQTDRSHLTQIPNSRHYPNYHYLTQNTALEKLTVTKPLNRDVICSDLNESDVEIVGITQPKCIIPARHQIYEGVRNQGNIKDISKASQYKRETMGLNKQDLQNTLVDHFMDVSFHFLKKKPTTTNYVLGHGVHAKDSHLPSQSADSSDLQLNRQTNKSGGSVMLNADNKLNPKPHVYKPTPLKFQNLANMRTKDNVKMNVPHPQGYFVTHVSNYLKLPGNEQPNISTQTAAKNSEEENSSKLPYSLTLQGQTTPIITDDVVGTENSETVKSDLNPLRRSGRKQKIRQCDEQYESDLETDGGKNALYKDVEISDSESSWELETVSRTKTCSKKRKPFVGPRDPTAVDVTVKEKYKCWLCQHTYVFCLHTKDHIINKHSEGLCSIELKQTEQLGKVHILLYCPRTCDYATYDIDGFKKHTAYCDQPLLSVKGIKYLELNNYFIQHIYPELINTDTQVLVGTAKTRKELEKRNLQNSSLHSASHI